MSRNNIEQQMQSSTQKSVRLSAMEKADMWKQIEFQIQQEEHTVQDAEPLFKRRISFWWMIAPVAFALLGLFFLVPQESGNIQEFTSISWIHDNTESLGESTTEEVALSEEEETSSDSESATEEDQKPTSTEYALLPRIENQWVVDEFFFGGRGGGSDTNYSLWNFAFDHPSQGDTPQTVPELSGFSLGLDKVQRIAAILGISDELYPPNSATLDSWTTNFPQDTEHSCLGYRRNELTTPERCFAVSTSGFIHLEQQPSAAQPDGMAEALEYITAITGSSADAFTIEAVSLTEDTFVDSFARFDEYYTLYPNTPRTDFTLPFLDFGWHVAFDEGKLVSLYGIVFSVHDEGNASYEVISQDEAQQRLLSEFSAITSTMQSSFHTIYTYSPFLRPLDIPDADVAITIHSIQLQYEAMLNISDRENLGRNTIRFVPVYTIRGEEASGAIFDVVMDATVQGTLKNQYRVIRNPQELAE